MNKVINLKKEYSFQYKYSVDGCIFTIEQMPESKTWVMVGYSSEQSYEERDYFNEWNDIKKKHLVNFLKYTFEKQGWGV